VFELREPGFKVLVTFIVLFDRLLGFHGSVEGFVERLVFAEQDLRYIEPQVAAFAMLPRVVTTLIDDVPDWAV
jgi:hypothetical protein